MRTFSDWIVNEQSSEDQKVRQASANGAAVSERANSGRETLNSNRERLGVRGGLERTASETALQQRHQSCVPVPHNEQ
jgi:hypothetical protein